MSAEDFVSALSDKNMMGAEDAFKNAMSSKVGDALEDKRKEVEDPFKKESDELNESYKQSKKNKEEREKELKEIEDRNGF